MDSCMQNCLSSAVRASYLKANGKAVHVYLRTHPSEWQDNLFSSSTAVSLAHVFLTYIFALCYYWQAWQLMKHPRCSKCKRTSVRSWRAPTQQHHGNHSRICYTHSSAFLLPRRSRSTIKQIFRGGFIMATWSQHMQRDLVLSLLDIVKVSTCLHVRVQLYNTDKNKQWKLWNFATLRKFSTC